MSSYLTVLHNFDQPVYSPDFNFIATALNYKQEKYDANKAKLQTLYDQIGALQVKKDIDRDYIESRLQEVKGIANKYSYVDLSDDSFANSMLDNISQIVDGKVEEAVLSKRKMDREDREWEALRLKDPKKYSEKNHQYAKIMSDRQRYLSSSDVGDRYLGGADVIEYVDLGEKYGEVASKLAKELQAKYLTEGPQSGPFKSLSTMETVPREQMEVLLYQRMNDQDKKQLEIDAWSKYDQLPEEVVRETYETNNKNTLDAIDKNLERLQTAKANNEDPKREEQYDELIQQLEQRKTAIEENTYDNLRTQYTRKDLYTRLHTQNFIDGFLEGYSYGPREIKREVDQTQKEYVNYLETVRHHRATEQAAKDNLDLAKQKFAWEKRKDILENPDLLGEPQNPGDRSYNLDYSEKEIAGLDVKTIAASNRESARKQTDYKILKSRGVNFEQYSYSELKSAMKGWEDAIGKGKTISVGGTTFDTRKPEDVAALHRLNGVLNTSKTEKVMAKTMHESITGSAASLAYAYKDGKVDKNDLPGNTFKIVNGKEVKITAQEGRENYARLLRIRADRDKQLTADQKKTLEAYTAIGLMGKNSVLGDNEKTYVGKALRNNILQGVVRDSKSNIPLTYQDIVGTGQAIPLQPIIEKIAKEHPEYDTKRLVYEAQVEARKYRENPRLTVNSPFKTLSQITQQNFRQNEYKITESYTQAMPRAGYANPGDREYKGLLAAYGTGENYKGKITYKPVDVKADGSFKKVEISIQKEITTKVGEEKVIAIQDVKKEITREEFEKQTGIPLGQFEQTNYDVSRGDAAEELKLGRSMQFTQRPENTEFFKEIGKAQGDTRDRVSNLVSRYEDGKFSIKLENIDNTQYGYNIYDVDTKKRVNKYPVVTGLGRLEEQDVIYLLMSSTQNKEDAFKVYLKNEVYK